MKLFLSTKGQGTVEAAFVIPIMLTLLLLLLRPGIVIYDYIVMNNAAEEGARLAATLDVSSAQNQCIDFIKHRLSSVPQQDLFHKHSDGCSWVIEVQGGESAAFTTVAIKNELKPLPLLGTALALLGATNDAGAIVLSVERTVPTQPAWVFPSGGSSPREWVELW